MGSYQVFLRWSRRGVDPGDPALFRRVLCRLSYSTVTGCVSTRLAVPTGLEPATSGLTGRRELQLHHGTRRTGLCTPNGIRTRAATLKGWCPRPLDDGGSDFSR